MVIVQYDNYTNAIVPVSTRFTWKQEFFVITANRFELSDCRKPPSYVPYKGTYVPYNGTFSAPDQGPTLDVWGQHSVLLMLDKSRT